MAPGSQGSVFVSYAREDAAAVDLLVEALKRHDLDVWIDRERINPGERWRDAITSAIGSGSCFLACFSSAFIAREVTYMKEELALAAELMRKGTLQTSWFIPVRLDRCNLADIHLPASLNLSDLQVVDLHTDWADGVQGIAGAVCRVPPKAIQERSVKDFVVLVADFVKLGTASFDIAGRIFAALTDAIQGANLSRVFLERVHRRFYNEDDSANATEISRLAHERQARFVIYGVYDDAGITPSFQLGRAGPMQCYPDAPVPGGRWEINLKDFQLAARLGIASDRHAPGISVLGPQRRLREHAAGQDIGLFVRDIIPVEMTLLTLTSVAMLADPEDVPVAARLAAQAGDRLWKLAESTQLSDPDFWRSVTSAAFEAYAMSLTQARTKGATQGEASLDNIIAVFSKQISVDPGNSLPLNNRGYSYHLRNAPGDVERAIADYGAALDRTPALGMARLHRGMLLFNTRRFVEAMGDFELLLEAEPKHEMVPTLVAALSDFLVREPTSPARQAAMRILTCYGKTGPGP